MTGTAAGAARARAVRTRTKHNRWIAELTSTGWSTVAIGAARTGDDEVSLYAWCQECDVEIAEWRDVMDSEAPLSDVVAAVAGHTCEKKP